MFSENPPFSPLGGQFLPKTTHVTSFWYILLMVYIDSIVDQSVLVIWKTKVSFLSLKTLYLISQIDPVNHW